MVRSVYMGIRHLDSTTGELYELPQLLKRCVLRLRGVSRALISQGVAGRKWCVAPVCCALPLLVLCLPSAAGRGGRAAVRSGGRHLGVQQGQ